MQNPPKNHDVTLTLGLPLKSSGPLHGLLALKKWKIFSKWSRHMCIIPQHPHHIYMVSKHKKDAAARAWAGMAAAWKINLQPMPSPGPIPEIDFVFSPEPEPEPEPIKIFSDSDSDCGYVGGVNYYVFDSDDEFEPGSDGCWSDSDGESLAELEGEELESSLCELKAELDALAAPSKYDLITAVKTSQEWKTAEKKRGFGYTGNSQRTKHCNAKAAVRGR
jgi:hypothetical protein